MPERCYAIRVTITCQVGIRPELFDTLQVEVPQIGLVTLTASLTGAKQDIALNDVFATFNDDLLTGTLQSDVGYLDRVADIQLEAKLASPSLQQLLHRLNTDSSIPGFQPLVDAAIAMDADGYDIVNDDGTINVNDLSSQEPGLSYCLQAPFDSTLVLTFLIPIEPELRSESWDVGTVSSVGVGVSGVPFKGYTPSVTVAETGVAGTGSGNIPSLDHCGGHPDPAGYYHWHLVPQGTNTVLASDTYDYTEQYGITCSNSNVAFDEPASFAGLAIPASLLAIRARIDR